MSVVSAMSAQKEYEKLKVKQEDIQNLMTWLSEQAHLPHQFITGKIFLNASAISVLHIRVTL